MHVPAATYRIQFRPEFGFKAAGEILDYLCDLGISTIYASPIFKARPGSTHGYDVADPTHINEELGSPGEFNRLIEKLHSLGMRWLQDVVPNHMVYASANRFLMDIFEKGPSSPYFEFFDIVWDHLRLNLRGKLIAPFLGRPYAEILEAGELKLKYAAAGFSINYYETVYPLRIESYATILGHRIEALREKLGERKRDFTRVLALSQILKNLPYDPAAPEQRNAQIRLAKDLLWELYEENTNIQDFVQYNVSAFNENADLLDSLLGEQWFRLTFWRVASKEINYQRFFNVNELISVRVEDDQVFDYLHSLIRRLLEERLIDGLRIDHIDGLYDPNAYLERLRNTVGDAYVIVEKILEEHEWLPAHWPVQGTTGYEFLNRLNGLFVDSKTEHAINRIYADFIEVVPQYRDLIYEKQELIIERHLTGDLDNIAHLLKRISTTTREGIDLTMDGMKKAIIQLSAVFPIYRTYMRPGEVSDTDAAYLEQALAKARDRNPSLSRELAFLENVLLLRIPDSVTVDDREQWMLFVMRFQQFTSPLMAKGLEDTVFYLYNRLSSLNEVGANPARFGYSLAEYHEFISSRSQRHPLTLNATCTHDTKRGEDARVRIDVLSEMPDEWESRLRSWCDLNRHLKTDVGVEQIPDKNEEYLLYQTLIGAWPAESRQVDSLSQRIADYLTKAAREAKVHTDWLDPNPDYERALTDYARAILDPSRSAAFLENFLSFQRRVAWHGYLNSLSQVLLKITSPGIPDFYQGSELWDLNLVDPDNRRPVDYKTRIECLAELKRRVESDSPSLLKELVETIEDGRIKMFVIYRALTERRRHSDLFSIGTYTALHATGARSNHVVSFARRLGSQWATVVAPRLTGSLVTEGQLPVGARVWGDSGVVLPEGAPCAWREVFTGRDLQTTGYIDMASACAEFPMAFLFGNAA